ncbi:RagB/SusD family nutrient uptake outer membrane protein [Elizabethkingia ursingii]|uniref:RagB/SusD family nutrient uptake outer membrane protein n=1 Tax=Elizabethkingia ursingii TaxID=1756150 RepID=A0AAJ3N9V8_9FLAO|nr:RagB/SusD family nutrient uptake outer membrane protein [Elizabethkingia ursingii]AQX10253.1 hypothetical protein BBD34_17150 [Elizabethkingia ursingii]OPB72381.1 hypothetical protein BAY32_12550 [Elizabethkingia ursingii]
MKKTIIPMLLFLGALTGISGCKDFLEEKSDTQLTTPTTLKDNQALLDHYRMVSDGNFSSEVSAGDVYVTDADFQMTLYDEDKRLYTWQGDGVSKENGNDWSNCYQKINICNTVLDNLKTYRIKDSDYVKGQALALRGSLYLEAAQVWCLAYDKKTAEKGLGLPLRLDSDMNQPSVRSSLQKTYDQVLDDLHKAVGLLPVQRVSNSRMSKIAALGFLSRAYLYMGDYKNALLYGKQALSYPVDLLDFNALNPGDEYPVKERNKETIFDLGMGGNSFLRANTAKISRALYDSYENNDLRKSIYFRGDGLGNILFKGNYSGSTVRTMHLGTDELYLIVAESYVREGDIEKGMDILNALLRTRWKKGYYKDYTANSQEKALEIIFQERRKELIFRGLRWADIKRYNRDGAGIVLSREVLGKTYTLPANDLRYAIALPQQVIVLSGMPQNKR